MGCHSLLQGIFPTQGSNLGLSHCRQILYHLSPQGSPCNCHRSRKLLTGVLKTIFGVIMQRNPTLSVAGHQFDSEYRIEVVKETATHSSILAWRIPWTEEPSGLRCMGSQRVGHDWVTKPPPPQDWGNFKINRRGREGLEVTCSIWTAECYNHYFFPWTMLCIKWIFSAYELIFIFNIHFSKF